MVVNEDWISRACRRCSKAVAGGAVHATTGTIPSVRQSLALRTRVLTTGMEG
jgi:hypothetical protein